MKINIKIDAMCGKTTVPSGEYWVSLHHEAGEIFLSRGGKDLKIKATKRRNNTHAKKMDINFSSGGGRIWSLVITTPKYGEWVAFFELS